VHAPPPPPRPPPPPSAENSAAAAARAVPPVALMTASTCRVVEAAANPHMHRVERRERRIVVAQKLDRPRQAYLRLGQSNAQKRLVDSPGLSTFWRNDNTEE